MRLYADIDDVLAETTRRILRLANRRFGCSLDFEALGSFDLGVALGLDEARRDALFAEINAPGFLDRLPTRRGAVPVLRAWASAGHSVDVVTGRPPYARELTAFWLKLRKIPCDSLLIVDKYGRFPDAPRLETLRGLHFDVALEDSLETAAFLLESAWSGSSCSTVRGTGTAERCRRRCARGCGASRAGASSRPSSGLSDRAPVPAVWTRRLR